jgi:hypothetical protein
MSKLQRNISDLSDAASASHTSPITTVSCINDHTRDEVLELWEFIELVPINSVPQLKHFFYYCYRQTLWCVREEQEEEKREHRARKYCLISKVLWKKKI